MNFEKPAKIEKMTDFSAKCGKLTEIGQCKTRLQNIGFILWVHLNAGNNEEIFSLILHNSIWGLPSLFKR